MYWIIVLILILCGQITHIISFTLASGLPLFYRTAGDSFQAVLKVCNWCILKKTAKVTCKDILVQSIWKCHEETCFLFEVIKNILYLIFFHFCFPSSLPSLKSNQSLSFLCKMPSDLQVENLVYELSTVLLHPIHCVSRHTQNLFFSCSFSSVLFKLQYCLKFFKKTQLL